MQTTFPNSGECWLVSRTRERRVTWIELFFDLIFVAAVSQVSAPLTSDFSAAQLGRYTLMFVLVWSAWCGQTFYSTRFSVDDVMQRMAIVAQCFIAAVMAANARGALDGSDSAGFGAAYGGLRLLLVLQYLRVRRIPEAKVLATRYAFGYGVAAAIWIASGPIPAPLRFWFWGLGIVCDFLTPVLVMRESRKIPPHRAHLPERFSLFVVIVIGEFVAQVMRGVESQEGWTASAALTAIGAIAFAFLVASSYFDAARADSERHMHDRRTETRFYIWNYSHLPLCLAIGTAGIGFGRAIASKTQQDWSHFDAAALGVSVIVIIASLLGVAAGARTRSRTLASVAVTALQFGVTSGFAALVLTTIAVSPLLVVGAAVLVCGVNFLVESRKGALHARAAG